jgi:hypothetical protein
MPISIKTDLESSPGTLVVTPKETRLSLDLKLEGMAPEKARAVYRITGTNSISFIAARCLHPGGKVKMSARVVTVTDIPVSASTNLVIGVKFSGACSSQGVAFNIDVDVTDESGAEPSESSCSINCR